MTDEQASKQGLNLRLIVGVLFAAIIVAIYLLFGDKLSLAALAQHEDALRHHLSATPVRVFLVAAAIYITITGLSLPGSISLTILFGWYFGFLPGVLLVSFASTTGATVAFLISRCLFYRSLQSRFEGQLTKFNRALEREGPFFLLSLRLIPVVPFFAVNALMGLTPICVRTFWWASQLGMLPLSAIYVYAGASVPNLQTLADKGPAGIVTYKMLAAVILLGVFSIVARIMIKRLLPSAASTEQAAT